MSADPFAPGAPTFEEAIGLQPPDSARANGSTAAAPSWLLDAADLLAEPDPGPTPWLVEGLIVDQAIVAFVGRWKTTKSYGLLDLCISIATDTAAFGVLEIPNPGPVVYVCEESGRAALWRRLDALCRGRAIDPARLAGRLYVAANARVKLDDPGWQAELLQTGKRLEPRLIALDPLARMKAAGREENSQTDMAAVVEYLRLLRDETASAVGFVHHTGHAGDTMRGSSDLESVWESRLAWKRDGQSPLVEIHSEHREAEAGEPIRYRIAWDHDTRSMRFPFVANGNAPIIPLRDRVVEYVAANPKQKAREIAAGVDVRGSDVDRELANLVADGTLEKGRSGRTDRLGREIRDEVYTLPGGSSQGPLFDTPGTSHGTSHDGPSQHRTNQDAPHPQTRLSTSTVPRPGDGTTQDEPPAGQRGSVARPPSIEGDGPDEPPDDPHEAST